MSTTDSVIAPKVESPLGRHRFYIWTAGCQMNRDDGERIARELMLQGHIPVSHPDRASFVILNGCSVRDNSDRKTYGRIDALGARKKRDPDLMVALTGCSANASQSELQPYNNKLDVIFDSRNIDALINKMSENPGPVVDDWETFIPSELPGSDSVSRFVTVIYGCSKRCTFCIVPFRRGNEESREVQDIAREIRTKTDEGAVEITLLGQIVNRYGRDLAHQIDLADLLYHIDTHQLVPRLRFLTAHPRHLDDRLIEAIAECKSVCEEINLPVQSGDNLILKRMGRGYNTDFFVQRINKLRETVPNIAISTDIIVGFPGETEEQFQHTLNLLNEVKFDVVHVAAFSPRVGTVADRWGDNIAAAEKMERLHQVESLQENISLHINKKLEGSWQEVLFESLTKSPVPNAPKRWSGRTRGNKLVFCDADEPISRGDITDVFIHHSTPWSLRGSLTPKATNLAEQFELR